MYVTGSNVSVKINARLDDELARRVAQVQRRTRKPLTQIVKESLARYCDTELAAPDSPLDALMRAGFVGVAEGPSDLSARYKDEFRDLLARKIR